MKNTDDMTPTQPMDTMTTPPQGMEGEVIKIPENYGQTIAPDTKNKGDKTFRKQRERSRS